MMDTTTESELMYGCGGMDEHLVLEKKIQLDDFVFFNPSEWFIWAVKDLYEL